MPKDPAFLFYPGDWMGGTMTLNRHQKGCYMDLLIAQFNNGPLSLETIKTVLGQDQAAWTVLSSKFKQDSQGNFSNERLATEIEKRKKFVESKVKNGFKGGRPPNNKTYTKPIGYRMVNLPENENKNEDEVFKDEVLGEGFFINQISKEMELKVLDISNVKEFIKVACRIELKDSEVLKYWGAFKADNFGKKDWYDDREKLISHFRHTLKNQLNKNGTHNTLAGGKTGGYKGKSSGAYELLDEIRNST